ncbi:hypothetical protein BaRGS_00003398 [Batillaria attramentaria]|uniref:PX domain-containing protein n=1 Tax=Batillaria attramentaria TaxID=370345 RepID=A0ABD0M181_9CAEN
MATFLKKIRPRQSVLDDRLDETPDPVVEALEDDEPPYPTTGFKGKLSFGSDGESSTDLESSDKDLAAAYDIKYEGSPRSNSRVTFEVTSAEVIKEARSSPVLPGHSSHVDYTIVLSANSGEEKVQTKVVRRYSDFEHLHKKLKKKFPALLSPIVFPQKLLLGNFTRETIAKRSRAFEQYLTHLYSIFDIRYSSVFAEFFTGDDYAQGVKHFLNRQYFEAIPCFERYLPVIEKLYGNSHHRLGQVVCALVVCHKQAGRPDVAEAYARLGLGCLPESSLTTALLQSSARLRWSLGRDKIDIERRLQEQRECGMDVDNTPDLEDLVCQQLRASSA